MKTTNKQMMAAVLTAVMFTASGVWAGNLTPPGAPGATMKTLDQVEARMPITSPGTTITQPGSYYLTTNLFATGADNGVEINASDVTLDLNGFTVSGDAATANGIRLHIVENVIVKNGSIRGCNFNGIYAFSASNCVFRDLRLFGNARASVSYAGLIGGKDCVIEACVIKNNGGYGVKAYTGSKVRDNIIEGSAAAGLYVQDSGSYVEGNIVRANADNYEIDPGNQLNLLLCEIPETLDWPCSVKLAGPLATSQTGVNGITVAANDVTIDMAGHTLVGPGASSGSGIYQASSYRNLRVFNGKAVEWQGTDKAGIYAIGKSAILSDLQVSTNAHGIFAGEGSTLFDCAAYNNGSYGIYANYGSTISDCTAGYNGFRGIYAGAGSTLSGCTASDNGNDGILASIGCTISDCAAYDNDDDGIEVGTGSTITDCAVQSNGDDGIYADVGSTISGCAASFNTGDGIQVFYGSRVLSCVCDNNGDDGAGIHAPGVGNRIEGNTCTANDRGIDVDLAGNFIVKNTCSGNTLNWDIAAGNVCLVVNATTAGAISGNSGGTAPGSTDPNANFTY